MGGVTGDEMREDVGETGFRVDRVELARLDERSEDGPMLAAAIGASERSILAVEREQADRALDNRRIAVRRSLYPTKRVFLWRSFRSFRCCESSEQ
jgi:hypothetical protein